MASPRVLLVRAPGTNCDKETAFAFQLAGATAEVVHVNRLLEQPALLDHSQILCFPGGFSFGDDIAAGRIMGNQIRLRLADTCREFKDAGKLILGICNGFQILAKTGLLDIDDDRGPMATLTWNDSGKYEARWVHLQASPQRCVFLPGVERMELPIAHAEGKFLVRDRAAFDLLAKRGQLVLRYCTAAGDSSDVPYPANPNGATSHVAGVTDTTGRVLGLMPHPERFVTAQHHPNWTTGLANNEPHGRLIFANAVQYFD